MFLLLVLHTAFACTTKVKPPPLGRPKTEAQAFFAVAKKMNAFSKRMLSPKRDMIAFSNVALKELRFQSKAKNKQVRCCRYASCRNGVILGPTGKPGRPLKAEQTPIEIATKRRAELFADVQIDALGLCKGSGRALKPGGSGRALKPGGSGRALKDVGESGAWIKACGV